MLFKYKYVYIIHNLFHLLCFIQYCFFEIYPYNYYSFNIEIYEYIMQSSLYFIYIAPYEPSIHLLLSFSPIYRRRNGGTEELQG